MTPFPELLGDRRTFHDVIVLPIEFVPGKMFVGGPIWPRYAFQFAARHFRGRWPLPRDDRPKSIPAPVAELRTGTWCGPIVEHFGHGIADFGMRIAASAHADPSQPLLFGLPAIARVKPPGYFWPMLEHFGATRERIVLIREPTLVRELHVFPQSERRRRSGPSRAHLDFLERILPRARPTEVGGTVYVSRSHLKDNRRFLAGEIAGESYLERVLAEEGARILYPEEHSLAEQLDIYRHARRLVFSEGSALHGLQLLGRFDADVVVIARRRGARIAYEGLKPRARSLTYIHALRGTVHGLAKTGKPDPVRGIAVLEPRRLLEQLAALGLDLAPRWDAAAYESHRDAGIAAWKAAVLARALHPGAEAEIDRCMRRLAFVER